MLNYKGLNLTDIFSQSPMYPTLFAMIIEFRYLCWYGNISVSNWNILYQLPYMIHCNQNSRILNYSY